MNNIFVRVNPRGQIATRHRAGLEFTSAWAEIVVDDADRAAIEQDPYLEVSESDPAAVETNVDGDLGAMLQSPRLPATWVDNPLTDPNNPPSANADGASAQGDVVWVSAELVTVDSSGDAPAVVDEYKTVVGTVIVDEPIDPVEAIEVTSQANAHDSADDLVTIKNAINLLDKTNPENWLKDGRPSTKAIEEIAGVTVPASLRDLVWIDIQAEAAE